MSTVSDKKTILHLPQDQASTWCWNTALFVTDIYHQEYFLLNDTHKLAAQSIEGMMYGDGRTAHGSPHLKRISYLGQGDHQTTTDLMMFLSHMSEMLRGNRRTPFEDEDMSPDEARAWVASMRKRLRLKIRHDRDYLKHCAQTHTTPHKDAVTAEEITKYEDIVLLLEELAKTFPPLKLSRAKKGAH